MIQPYKDREIKPEKPIYVYRNLHREGRWYSIKQFNKVVGHTQSITLSGCTFIVSESGRKRVIQEAQKNVHAYVRGFITQNTSMDYDTTLTYDPYQFSTFVTKPVFKPVSGAEAVIADESGVRAYEVKYLL